MIGETLKIKKKIERESPHTSQIEFSLVFQKLRIDLGQAQPKTWN